MTCEHKSIEEKRTIILCRDQWPQLRMVAVDVIVESVVITRMRQNGRLMMSLFYSEQILCHLFLFVFNTGQLNVNPVTQIIN